MDQPSRPISQNDIDALTLELIGALQELRDALTSTSLNLQDFHFNMHGAHGAELQGKVDLLLKKYSLDGEPGQEV